MWASEAPCSSISKNQMKCLKPGLHIAKILLFRTHHLWNSTTELILNLIYLLTLGYTIEHNWTRQIRWSLEGWIAWRIRCCENIQFNWREILVSWNGNFPNRNVTSRKYFGVLLIFHQWYLEYFQDLTLLLGKVSFAETEAFRCLKWKFS